MAIDTILKDAIPEIGLQFGEVKLGAIAYADDLILMAAEPSGLQKKLVALLQALRPTGMMLNTTKSRGLTILKDRKRKCLVLAPRTYASGTSSIQAMGVNDEIRYLGMLFNWKGKIAPKHTTKLQQMLTDVTEAPLKPYQRLDLLRTFIFPKLSYELTLGNAHRNTLKSLDILCRLAVRQWLRLPKDTPIAYLHAPILSGGLAIPCFSTSIPILQKNRYTKLLTNSCPLVEIMRTQKSFSSIRRLLDLPCRVGSSAVTTMSEVKEAWRDNLYRSVDGKELNTSAIDTASHAWLRHPARVFPRLHLRGIQLRGGVLPTKARGSRGEGRSSISTTCQGTCRQTETLAHILQKCERTHDQRCARHNRVMRKIDSLMRKKELKTWVEPIIPTGNTFIKPDLVVQKGTDAYILDVSIVSGSRLFESWDLKVLKYGSPDNTRAIQNWFSVPLRLQHIPIIISNRGLMFSPSGRGLRSLGLTARDIGDLCLLTILGSLKTFDFYTRGFRAT